MTFLDVHILQTVPPSNLNRDDTGAPKMAVYGGVNRARVSSQAWKRATRRAFDSLLDTADLGVRTKRVVELVDERLGRIAPELTDGERRERIAAVLDAIGLKVEKPRARKKGDDADGVEPFPMTEYLVFLSAHQLDRLAEFAAQDKPSKKDIKEAIDRDHGADVGLFGRMIANAADLNVDSAVQVAHAISTHAVATESDYFTAVDDQNPEEETGAGMIGTVEFNSATLYRYATVNVTGLIENLGDITAAAKAARAFIHGFVTAMPTGKRNTFANNTLPDVVILAIRDDQPLSLVVAFERAVPDSPDGYVLASAQRLATHHNAVTSSFANPPRQAAIVSAVDDANAALATVGPLVSFPELLDTAESAVVEHRAGAEG